MVSEAKKAAQRRYAAANPDKIRAREKGRDRAKRNAWFNEDRRRRPGLALFKSSKQSASRKGLEFSLTREEVENLVAPMVCEVSGMQLRTDEPNGPWLPSIDRIDNDLGYVPGNVRLVCWMFNRAKAHWPEEDFMRMVRGIALTAPPEPL